MIFLFRAACGIVFSLRRPSLQKVSLPATHMDVGRYDSRDGGGRAAPGAAAEGNAGDPHGRGKVGAASGTAAESSCRRPTGMWEGRATQGAVAGKIFLSPGSETKLGKL